LIHKVSVVCTLVSDRWKVKEKLKKCSIFKIFPKKWIKILKDINIFIDVLYKNIARKDK